MLEKYKPCMVHRVDVYSLNNVFNLWGLLSDAADKWKQGSLTEDYVEIKEDCALSLYVETIHNIGVRVKSKLFGSIEITSIILTTLESKISNFGQHQDCLQIDNEFFIWRTPRKPENFLLSVKGHSSLSQLTQSCQCCQCCHQRCLQQQNKLPKVGLDLMVTGSRVYFLSSHVS